MDEFWTIQQAAAALQVHERTIRRWIGDGRLKAVRVARTIRLPRGAVEALAAATNGHEQADHSVGCPGEGNGAMSEEKKDAVVQAGLQDVVAGESSICFIDGERGRLVYRGYDAVELAEHSTFEEVAYLLWYGRLPGRVEFEAFLDSFTGSMELPVETVMILRMFPKAATPMEVLRTAVSSMGHWDPDSGCTRLDACLRKAIRLTERIPLVITAHQRLRHGKEPVHPIPGKSIAYNFLYTLQGTEPDPDWVRAFDVALTLHADHEWNASTFTARVVASTMADMYSGVTAAIGALKGPLHGGANEEVIKMLQQIGGPERAEGWVKDALARKVKIPGFGHRVYRTDDPRAPVLKRYAEMLTRKSGDTRLFETACAVEQVTRDNTRVYPNVDFYSGLCYHAMGIEAELFTPIFAMSRTVGWTAHILEQWTKNRIIRPRAQYTGLTDIRYVPLDERGT
ncbi:MAG: excisionase family DNA-binding protein [Armatimonadetes bacterium]|nr:excisionase family DNA-binding protein [Armatimonadota bacterium]